MPVTPADIALELGLVTPDPGSISFQQWDRWIIRARQQISERLGDLAALDQATLDDVVTLAVAAHARRPDDAVQTDVQVDDGRVSRRYTTSSGQVTIRDEWWARLSPEGTSSGAFSVRPSFTPDC